MITISKRGWRRSRFVAIPVVLLAGGVVFASISNAASGGSSGNANYSDGRYIVTMVDDPVGSYDGYEAGFAATKPAPGNKIDPASPAVVNWQRHLTDKHDAALARVGATKIYDYTITNNGFAANLTGAQAATLAKTGGIVGLELDQMSQVDTTDSPHFLGLDAGGGIWSQLGGQAHAGEGIVVGVIDTGIWPESAAFAGDKIVPRPKNWHGGCVAGNTNFPVSLCNNKLVGARFYVDGFDKQNVDKSDFI